MSSLLSKKQMLWLMDSLWAIEMKDQDCILVPEEHNPEKIRWQVILFEKLR